jgi:hypothetical protein
MSNGITGRVTSAVLGVFLGVPPPAVAQEGPRS